jgi:uncharacterized protein YndB with AHSA1/START domain
METQTNTNELTITRTFNAPRPLVWKAWTDPELYKKWWGPSHFTCPVAKFDLRVGGQWLSCMRSPDGKDFWSTGFYREITPHDRLVFTDSFADEQGDIVPASHYGMPDMPLEMLVTITLAEQDGKTVMTLVHSGMPVDEHGANAKEGWSQSFDKLAATLKAEQA